MNLFNDKMSSTEVQMIFFEYASNHRGENLENVKKEFKEVLYRILDRESQEDEGYFTAYHL